MPDLSDASEIARSAMLRLRDELPAIFGSDLVSIWLYGGQLRDSGSLGDVDGHVILARDPSTAELVRVRTLHKEICRTFGIRELDVWYVLLSEASLPDPPRDVNWHEEARDENWALKRAHWLAGACVVVFGRSPADIVLRPSWSEVEAELVAQVQRAGEEIERSPRLGMLSLRLCRVVRTLVTRDVVQTKLNAARALLPELSGSSREHVAAAIRTYRGEPLSSDADAMVASAANFYAEIRGLVDRLARA